MEIDLFDTSQKPVKRTDLGRFKHKAIAESADGHIAAYMVDEQRFNCCYKYISDGAREHLIDQVLSPFDEGTLYVAKYNDDGIGEWLALTIENPLLAERFVDQGELLINTRIASDILGVNFPQWIAPNKQLLIKMVRFIRQWPTIAVANPIKQMQPTRKVRITMIISFAWKMQRITLAFNLFGKYLI